MSDPSTQPLVSAAVPGTGGVIKRNPDDFRVEELPAYTASGEGDHILARIRKRGLSTFDVVGKLAAALSISERDIGTAGLKDKHAVTTQQISLPPPLTPEAVLALDIDGVTVLSADRHGNKLRTGHTRGNRFVIVVRDTRQPADEAADLARETLSILTTVPGAPNWFGEQRFGIGGRNADIGRALITGEHRGQKPRGRKLRLLLSAIQSHLFNEVLARRLASGQFRELVEGDVLAKTDSGGVFVTPDIAADAARFAAGEVVVTGPMFGPKMKRPLLDSAADRLESAVLDDAGLDRAAFTRFAKLTPGTRRPLSVALGNVAVKPIGDDAAGGAIEVTFSLPSGSYATSVLREITHWSPPLDSP